MTDLPLPRPAVGRDPRYGPSAGAQVANLGDILERVLDRGVVIAGDIRINLLDIELLTIKLRLVVASVDTAREMGIDWWEHDPFLNARARRPVERAPAGDDEPGSRAADGRDDRSGRRRSGHRERTEETW